MRDNYYSKGKKPFKKATEGGESSQDPRYAHIIPVQAEPIQVIVYGNNFDRALKAFRSLVQKERVLSEYKDRQSYEKPSDKKRRKRNEMKRKLFELEHADERFDSEKKPAPKKRFNRAGQDNE